MWEHVRDKWEERTKEKRREKIKKDVEDANYLRALGGGNNDGDGMKNAFDAGKQYVDSALAIMSPLLDKVSPNNNNGNDAMIQMMMKSQENMTMMMVAMMKANTDTLLAVIGGKNNDNSQSEQWEKAMGFMEKVMNVKASLEPKDEDLITRIGTVVMDNMETLMSLFKKPENVREQDTMYQTINSDKKMQEIKKRMHEDKEFAKRLIMHLDKKVGAGMTDKLLNGFMRYERPPETKDAEYEKATASGGEEEKGE
jgi:hypothetical protein